MIIFVLQETVQKRSFSNVQISVFFVLFLCMFFFFVAASKLRHCAFNISAGGAAGNGQAPAPIERTEPF